MLSSGYDFVHYAGLYLQAANLILLVIPRRSLPKIAGGHGGERRVVVLALGRTMGITPPC